MDNTLTESAVDETVVFLNYFKDLHDPRQQGKVCYPLEEILLLCLLAVVAGAETITEIAIFGAKKLDLLRRFRSFRDGTPTHDHLGDILAVLDAGQFQSCFAAWVASITGIPEGVIAIDGKTSRRSESTSPCSQSRISCPSRTSCRCARRSQAREPSGEIRTSGMSLMAKRSSGVTARLALPAAKPSASPSWSRT